MCAWKLSARNDLITVYSHSYLDRSSSWYQCFSTEYLDTNLSSFESYGKQSLNIELINSQFSNSVISMRRRSKKYKYIFKKLKQVFLF